MTTLHALRRTYALTFSELALVTGVETRRLAAFEYHGCPLAPDEHHRIAAFFGLADSVLESGFITRHVAEPTLSPSRARALVLVAAAITISWGLRNTSTHERNSVGALLAAPFSAALAYADELDVPVPAPSLIPESLTIAADLLRQSASTDGQAEVAPTPTPLPQPEANAAESSPPPSTPLPTTTPLVEPSPTPTADQPTAQPTSAAVSSATDSGDLSFPTPPGLPPQIVWPTVMPAPPAAPPVPTEVPPAPDWDAYENNYDFDHAAAITPETPIRQLNFACPDHGDCADNDFFQVQLSGGSCYRVATRDLAPGIDTNVIVYGPERDRRPALGGNDNAAPGELRSQVDVCLPGRGPKTGFIVVGNRGNQRPPDPVADRTYTLQVTRLESVKQGQPNRCPLLPERGSVIVVQGWGVGTHAPAAQWGGVDLIVQGGPTAGTPIVATHAGVVQVFLNTWPGGNYVSITSDTGWRTAYAHLSRVLVRSGQYVEAGTIIGTVGQTGWATGPHLHYETWHRGVNVDPAPHLFCDG